MKSIVLALTLLIAGNQVLARDLVWQDYDQPGFQATRKAAYEAIELTLIDALHRINSAPHPDDAKILSFLERLIMVCGSQGKYDTAEQYCKLAVQFSERHPNETVRTFFLKTVLANLYFKQNKFSLAEVTYKNVLADKTLSEPVRVKAMTGLAEVKTKETQYSEATTLFEQASATEKLLEEWAPEDHMRYAKCLYLTDKLSPAEKQLDMVLEKDERELGKDQPALAASLNDLALVCSKQHKPEAAEQYMRRAITISRHFKYADLADWLDNLSELLKAENKTAESQSLSEEAKGLRSKKTALGSRPITVVK